MNFGDYPFAENIANALTHGVGVLIFLTLCPMLIATAVYTAFGRKITGAVLFVDFRNLHALFTYLF